MSTRPHLWAIIIPFLSAGVLLAAMSDAAALSQARKMWGNMANISQIRGPLDTYWTKQVGVSSKECKNDFTVLGSGLNTWEAAFFTVPADVVKGPLAGVLTLKNTVYDDVAVASWQWILDGQPMGPLITTPPVQRAPIQSTWDTTTIPNGVHVICGVAKDTSGNTGRSRATVIRIDQRLPSLGTIVDFSGPEGLPSMPGGN